MAGHPLRTADFGSIFGGWISGGLMNRGWDVGKARYAAMGLCQVFMPVQSSRFIPITFYWP